MGILNALSGVANPLSAKSRAGRKLQNEALKWAFNRCKLHTPYYVRSEIADRYKGTYTGTNPDGYVYFEFVFVRKTLIQKIPVTANGATAVHIYYTYNGEITDKRPKNYLTKNQLKEVEAKIIRESGGGFTFD